MDFARPHRREEGVVVRSNIRILRLPDNKEDGDDNCTNNHQEERSLDEQVTFHANQAARDLFGSGDNDQLADCKLYPERILDSSTLIEPGALVVIFKGFDNLDFVYATPGEIFHNRYGQFPHDSFIGKPYGCKIRSRDNQGYGFVYLLKPTPELWARSLPHRTQIVHELDASMVVFSLELRPNMVVCESGTGSGAMSHSILRTIAPNGHLHTYEFNQTRAETAREEFKKNQVDHLVTVHHKDVCARDASQGGFGLGSSAAHAVFLDLPEPWLAVAHAAQVLKPNCRLGSYSPCVEQSQRAVEAMKKAGFHSIKTMEVRLREYYVDEVELEMPPTQKRPRVGVVAAEESKPAGEGEAMEEAGEDVKSSATTEATADTKKAATTAGPEGDRKRKISEIEPKQGEAGQAEAGSGIERKPKTRLCARPFATIRGHTAFLTFATRGNRKVEAEDAKPKDDSQKGI